MDRNWKEDLIRAQRPTQENTNVDCEFPSNKNICLGAVLDIPCSFLSKTLRVQVEMKDLKHDSYISHGIFFAFRFPIFAFERHKLEDDVWLLMEVKEVVGGEGVLVLQRQTLVRQPHPVGGDLQV